MIGGLLGGVVVVSLLVLVVIMRRNKQRYADISSNAFDKLKFDKLFKVRNKNSN